MRKISFNKPFHLTQKDFKTLWCSHNYHKKYRGGDVSVKQLCQKKTDNLHIKDVPQAIKSLKKFVFISNITRYDGRILMKKLIIIIFGVKDLAKKKRK